MRAAGSPARKSEWTEEAPYNMATIKYKGVGIRAMSACVPRKVVYNKDLGYLIPKDEITKTIESIGIGERRQADTTVCSSDLCFAAAEKLLTDLKFDRNTIDALIFLSQTPDYRQPATAPSLSHRLGLPDSVMAFDMNMACAGYVYGLSVGYALAAQDGVRNVLLLVGETMSKTVSDHDKVTTPLFGDAGTATLIARDERFGESTFMLQSDGSGSDILRIPYGGYRNPSCIEGLSEHTDENGNRLTGEQLHMKGMDVFNFGLRVVPSGIKAILKQVSLNIEEIDLIHFHQANKFMTDFFAKKLKFPLDKVPYSLQKFGNTSAASIPLNIVYNMHDGGYPKRQRVILCGFGAGLTWGMTLLSLEHTAISALIEY